MKNAEVVDDEARVWMTVDHFRAHIDVVPTQEIDRKVVFDCGARNTVEAGIVVFDPFFLRQPDSDADRARRSLPFKGAVLDIPVKVHKYLILLSYF